MHPPRGVTHPLPEPLPPAHESPVKRTAFVFSPVSILTACPFVPVVSGSPFTRTAGLLKTLVKLNPKFRPTARANVGAEAWTRGRRPQGADAAIQGAGAETRAFPAGVRFPRRPRPSTPTPRPDFSISTEALLEDRFHRPGHSLPARAPGPRVSASGRAGQAPASLSAWASGEGCRRLGEGHLCSGPSETQQTPGDGRCPGAANLTWPGASGRPAPPCAGRQPPHVMSLLVWQGHPPHVTPRGALRTGERGRRTGQEQKPSKKVVPAGVRPGSDPVTWVHGSPGWVPCTSVGSIMLGLLLAGAEGWAQPPVCSVPCASLCSDVEIRLPLRRRHTAGRSDCTDGGEKEGTTGGISPRGIITVDVGALGNGLLFFARVLYRMSHPQVASAQRLGVPRR